MPRLVLLPVLLALSLSGCSGDDTESAVDPGPEPSSTEPSSTEPSSTEPASTASTSAAPPAWEQANGGGCGDAFFWAADAAGSHVIQIGVEQRERSTTAPTTLEIDLPDPTVTATLVTGTNLAGDQCNDLIMGRVSDEQPVVEGTGTITLDPRPEESGGPVHGTLVVSGLVAADGATLPDITVDTDLIGFYAG